MIDLTRPVVMGVLNVTPDSFSDGGRFTGPGEALEAAMAMVEDGADIVDVGGESTRPGAREVPESEELRRVLPFVRAAAHRLPVPLSVDTRKAGVARAALSEGAAIINDVSALAHDPEMGAAVAQAGAGVVLMHMRGSPETMASLARYRDVGAEVAAELREAVARALRAGVAPGRMVVDPGIGFAKNAEHSLALLGDLGAVVSLGYPVLVGPSRKSFLGAVLGAPADRRVPGTAAACVMAYLGGARIFRVHDVAPVRQALAVADAAMRAAGRDRNGGGET